ncbi:MAG: hypothetical protein QOJ63_646 [Solirubrobacteraceae bacterium]|jgi:hypothetical protein|nr:hypothetical protein [Solirubrobacteraceae bacterium]
MESGWVLVEAIWSAMLLLIVVGAVLTGIDTATLESGLGRGRATGATLAEQDQERLRSFRAVELSNYTEERTVNLGGGPYTVTSLVEWLRDFNGEPLSCTNGSAQADYLLIGSTVTSGTLRGHTIHLESLLAPPVGSFGPSQGTLGVQVVNRTSIPVAGMDVAVTGPDASVLPTNDLGCAIFGYIPPGSYTATLNENGWVDVSGLTQVNRSATVSGGNVNAITIQYDHAADIGVTFDTVVGLHDPQASTAKAVTAANSGVPPSGVRSFPASGRAASIDATNLFPFSSGYAVYAGNCASANPQGYDSRYFESNPGFVQTAPGASNDVVVRVPAINLLVTKGGVPFQSARVVLKETGPGCSDKTILTTNALGTLSDPGMPFGSYNVCADDGVRHRTFASEVQNRDPDGTTVPIVLSIPTTSTSGTSGICP